MSIGSKIAEVRTERTRTQEDLAHTAGISVSTLSRIERGLHAPELRTLRGLAAALDVPLIELVEAAEARE